MLKYSLTLRLLYTISLGLLFPWQAESQQSISDPELGGGPIAAARRTAIDARPFHRELDAGSIRKWMKISSKCTMAEFELFLAPLTELEQELLAKIESIPAPIVTRLHFEDLRAVLKNKQLSSYYEEERIGKHLIHTTPALENELYGAFDCVFASVGPPDGSPRYGDVIIRLRDSVREHGWATPFSGMHFIYSIRHQDARKMQQLLIAGKNLPTDPTNPLSLGFDDRLHFSHYVVSENHWNRALAYQAILVLRNAEDTLAGKQIQERFHKLLTVKTPDSFWELFIPAREKGLPPEEMAARIPFGYLEGKFENQFSLEEVTAIEVPSEKLKEALSWPEAQDHLGLISAKRD
ncbi:hypothetical protein [Bythopirellula polymerisocia]|uniref:Uncharacterized protein n=1 Tax=Bythopirellula polymerisocia TaxID=2528003 RepID=A0A5C6CMN3_9BACT|nr:hypothetical protein [Bythopirellula polymerisocia]TWU25850.1 hypothetical protein Pla144_30620 [Bythopirellula polymerisocia]